MSSDLLIINAGVVNENTEREADVLIHDGRIVEIGPDLSARPAKKVIDAAGRHLLPGMIDDQVHFREPGLTHKGDIATESRAAVAGLTLGISIKEVMPPATLTLEALEEKYQRATGRSAANFAFYLGASNNNLEEIKRLDPNQACGVKVFMGASTGNMLVDRMDALEGIFQHSPILIATHCEDTPMIHANEKAAREKYGEDVPMWEHANIRNADTCYASSSLAVSLAKQTGAKLHVLHLTTAREMELFTCGDINSKQITAEACVHHLWFNSDDYDRLGAQIKCNPAIKTPADQAAILQAVRDDRIDIIATDHAPHTSEEKAGKYFSSPAGLPLVQHAMLSLLDQVKRGIFELTMVVRKTSHAVADRYQMAERGYIREGYFADLILVDMNKSTKVTHDNLLYKCGWSPFEGVTFGASIDMTLVNGQIVWDGEKPAEPVFGQRLAFSRT